MHGYPHQHGGDVPHRGGDWVCMVRMQGISTSEAITTLGSGLELLTIRRAKGKEKEADTRCLQQEALIAQCHSLEIRSQQGVPTEDRTLPAPHPSCLAVVDPAVWGCTQAHSGTIHVTW